MIVMALAMISYSPRADTHAIFKDPKVIELADAACRGDSSVIRRLIDEGVSPQSQGKKEITPLEVAITCVNAEGVRAMIAGGAAVNRDIDQTYSPLILSVRHGNVEIISELLAAGADIYHIPANARHGAFGDAFDIGFETGNWSSFDYFIDKKIDINRQIDRAGNVDIATYAASLRRYDKVIYLLNLGYRRDLPKVLRYAEIDTVNSAGNSSYRDIVISRIKGILGI